MAAEKIQLELTESALMDDPDSALKTLCQLSRRGFELHVDDFGTGYSSLSYLQKLPVSIIKIDQSFVRDMDSNPNSATIVHSTIELAHSLNLKVVAEGVESQVILDRLASLGCDMAQGYHIAKPMAVEQLAAWLDR